MNKEMETVLFFAGWPKMIKLLVIPFFSMFMRDYRLVFFDKKINPKKIKGKIIGLAYSAGARDLIKLNQKYPELFKKRIFIAPAGINNEEYSLSGHCWSFSKELLRLLWRGKFKLFATITAEVIVSFINDPKESFKEIDDIRRFSLRKELGSLDGKNDYFIFPSRDGFMKPAQSPRNAIIEKTSGHFVLCENPKGVFEIIESIICFT